MYIQFHTSGHLNLKRKGKVMPGLHAKFFSCMSNCWLQSRSPTVLEY